MHGSVHDFVVINTVADGRSYPSGYADERTVREVLPGLYGLTTQPKFKTVLDIGSLDINGSMRGYDFCGQRAYWKDLIGCEVYTGLDLIPGKNVDVLGSAHNMPFPDESFDLVLCLEMLEHDSAPEKTLSEAYRVLKKGSPFLLATVDEKHEEHRHLGGGDTKTYNFITRYQLEEWLNKTRFTEFDIYHIGTDLFVYAVKL